MLSKKILTTIRFITKIYKTFHINFLPSCTHRKEVFKDLAVVIFFPVTDRYQIKNEIIEKGYPNLSGDGCKLWQPGKNNTSRLIMVVSWRNKTISVLKDVKKWFFCPVILLCVGMSNFMLSSLHYSDFHAQVQHRLLSITILACLIFFTKSNKSGSMNLFQKIYYIF